jgi:hypothetical protein
MIAVSQRQKQAADWKKLLLVAQLPRKHAAMKLAN